jgi:hypothetical protein
MPTTPAISLPDSSFATPENLMSRGTWVEATLKFGAAVWARVVQTAADRKLTMTKHARSFTGDLPSVFKLLLDTATGGQTEPSRRPWRTLISPKVCLDNGPCLKIRHRQLCNKKLKSNFQSLPTHNHSAFVSFVVYAFGGSFNDDPESPCISPDNPRNLLKSHPTQPNCDTIRLRNIPDNQAWRRRWSWALVSRPS